MNREIWQLLTNNIRNEKTYSFRKLKDLLAQTEKFDLIIFEIGEKSTDKDYLKNVFKSAYRLLNEEGRFCFSFNNKWSYARLTRKHHENVLSNRCSLFEVAESIEAAGFKNLNLFSVSNDIKDVKQIIHVKGDAGEYFAKKTNIKNKLLSSFLFYSFNRAYAVIANKVLRDNKLKINMIMEVTKQKKIEQIIIGKPNTIIILLGDVILRFPNDSLSRVRCRMGKRALNALRQTVISDVVPKFICMKNNGGKECFCESRIEGVSYVKAGKKGSDLIEKAAAFLAKFHCETAELTLIDENNFKFLFGRDFKRLSKFLPYDYKTKLSRLENYFRKMIIGKKIMIVFSHGDYKIENIMFDPNTKEINGIIDWDLSRRKGLPLLDLLYLLGYEDCIKVDKSIIQLVVSKYIKTGFNIFQKKIIKGYLKNINMEDCDLSLFLVMFWLFHVTHRFRQLLIEASAKQKKWLEQEVCKSINDFIITYRIKRSDE